MEENKKYIVHLGAYYTADVMVEAKDGKEAIQKAEWMDDVEFEFTAKADSDCWEASEEEVKLFQEVGFPLTEQDWKKDLYDKATDIYRRMVKYIASKKDKFVDLGKGWYIQIDAFEDEVYEIERLTVDDEGTIHGWVGDYLEEWIPLSVTPDYPQIAYSLNNAMVAAHIQDNTGKE